jgi:hypothetical protein
VTLVLTALGRADTAHSGSPRPAPAAPRDASRVRGQKMSGPGSLLRGTP